VHVDSSEATMAAAVDSRKRFATPSVDNTAKRGRYATLYCATVRDGAAA
jgi:hypothetical protein